MLLFILFFLMEKSSGVSTVRTVSMSSGHIEVSAAAWTRCVSLPNCGHVTVTVWINVDSCPSGCNQCGSGFENIICKTLTYTMLTFTLAAEMLQKSLSVRASPPLLSPDLDFNSLAFVCRFNLCRGHSKTGKR